MPVILKLLLHLRNMRQIYNTEPGCLGDETLKSVLLGDDTQKSAVAYAAADFYFFTLHFSLFTEIAILFDFRS